MFYFRAESQPCYSNDPDSALPGSPGPARCHTPQEIASKARRRLLNEPFFLIAIDLLLWLAAAAVYPISFYTYKAGEMIIGRALFQNYVNRDWYRDGRFFHLEYVLQKTDGTLLFSKWRPLCHPKNISHAYPHSAGRPYFCLQPDPFFSPYRHCTRHLSCPR